MFKSRENIRLSLIMLQIVLFGLLVYNYSHYTHKDTFSSSGKHVILNVSTQNCAISNPCIRIHDYKQLLVPGNDILNFMSFNRNLITEDSKAELKISRFLTLRQSFAGIPSFFIRYHQYPSKTDDPHQLS